MRPIWAAVQPAPKYQDSVSRSLATSPFLIRHIILVPLCESSSFSKCAPKKPVAPVRSTAFSSQPGGPGKIAGAAGTCAGYSASRFLSSLCSPLPDNSFAWAAAVGFS